MEPLDGSLFESIPMSSLCTNSTYNQSPCFSVHYDSMYSKLFCINILTLILAVITLISYYTFDKGRVGDGWLVAGLCTKCVQTKGTYTIVQTELDFIHVSSGK